MSFDDAQKCSANKKRGGGKCSNPAMANGKCRMHGGATPVGIANANFKHGKYSNALPKNLAQKYSQALEDPELTSTRNNIALIDGLLEERLEKLYKGETREFWLELQSMFAGFARDIEQLGYFETDDQTADDDPDDEFPDIIEENQKPRIEIKEEKIKKRKPYDPRDRNVIKRSAQNYLERMTEVIARGYEVYNVYERVEAMLEQHRKLTESENKRLEKLQQIITAEKALAIIWLLADSVRKNVSNKDERAIVSADITRAITQGISQKD